MARLKPIPVTIGGVAPRIRYRTPEPEEKDMKMLDAEAMETFNRLLVEWRQEGRSISWDDLNRAARLAREEMECREKAERQGEGYGP